MCILSGAPSEVAVAKSRRPAQEHPAAEPGSLETPGCVPAAPCAASGTARPSPQQTQEERAGAAPPTRPQGAVPPASDEDAVLAEGLGKAVAGMARLARAPGRLTCFHSTAKPGIGPELYMARLRQFFCCSGTCYVLALVYIDRLVKRCPDLIISEMCCHRLLLVSLMTAAKFHDDVFYANAYYAKVGGVSVQEMNRMEKQFLLMLGWRLQVQPEEFAPYWGLCRAASKGAAPALQGPAPRT